VVSLTYRATVDVPARFRKSKSVGAVFGLTCSKYQSGEIDWSGRISRRGDEMMRQRSQEIARDALSSDAAHTRKASAAVVLLRSQKKPDDFFRTAVADLNDLR
jgi:transposase